MSKIISLVLSILILANSACAAVTTLNTHTVIGKKSDTMANRVLEAERGLGTANNPTLYYDPAAQAWKFKNEGGSAQSIGSGGGGASGSLGTNLYSSADNADLETGTSQFTASGGSFTSTSSNPYFGASSGSWDASALNQTLSMNSKTINTGLLSQKCLASLSYQFTGSNGDYVLEVYDGSSVVASQSLTAGSSVLTTNLKFTCPASGSILVRLKAGVANPGAIKFDGTAATGGMVYLGSDFYSNAVGSTLGSPTLTKPVVYSFQFGGSTENGNTGTTLCSSDPCTLYKNQGNAVSVVNFTGSTGRYVVHWNSGVWANANYACVMSGYSADVGSCQEDLSVAQTTSLMNVIGYLGVGTFNTACILICFGEAPLN